MDRQTADALKKAMQTAMKAFSDSLDESVRETERLAAQRPVAPVAARPSPVTEAPRPTPSFAASSPVAPVVVPPTPIAKPVAPVVHKPAPSVTPVPASKPADTKAKKFDGLL